MTSQLVITGYMRMSSEDLLANSDEVYVGLTFPPNFTTAPIVLLHKQNTDVGQFTALQLRADPVRASALRRAGACRHRYAGCALEARQGLRECCAEAAGPEDVYLSEGAVWQDGQDRGDDEAASNGQPHYATLFRMCSASASLISV